MKCIIIEDQPPAQRILEKFIKDIGTLELKGVFPDAIQAMAFLKLESVDLIFLDIHLPKLTGFDFLKTMPNTPYVILTTAFSQYALESYEFNVVDYLLKPFSFQRFVKAVAKIPDASNTNVEGENKEQAEPPKKEIYIKSGHEHIKVDIDSIQYITTDSDYTEIMTREKKYLSGEPLRFWLKTLPHNQFIRIHKSHIINVKRIEKIVGNLVVLSGGAKLPIGRTYKEAFMKLILE